VLRDQTVRFSLSPKSSPYKNEVLSSVVDAVKIHDDDDDDERERES